MLVANIIQGCTILTRRKPFQALDSMLVFSFFGDTEKMYEVARRKTKRNILKDMQKEFLSVWKFKLEL